jgi:pyruvate/2-oxoacid:ferredoxin oxidoreductase beta subunit
LASGRDIVVIVTVKVGSSIHSYSLSVILLDLFSDAVSIFFVSVLVSDRAALVHVLPPEAERKGASLVVIASPCIASSPLRGLSVRSEGDFAGLADLVGHENSEEVEGSG